MQTKSTPAGQQRISGCVDPNLPTFHASVREMHLLSLSFSPAKGGMVIGQAADDLYG